jgi:predicted phage tail component-like protein
MNSFTFRGIKKDYIHVLRGSNRPAWAPIEREYIEIPSRAGAYPSRKKTKARPLPIPVLIKAKDIAELQKIKEDLAEWLITDGPEELILDDEPDRVYYAEVDGEFNPDEIVKYGQGIINFICPDPYKYGSQKTFSFSNNITVQNNGSAKTYPVVTVTFSSAATEYKISHSNGKFVRVLWNFVVGDRLEIDFQKQKIKINGNLAMPSLDFSSDFFALEPGSNEITVTPSGVSNQISYVERWL